ncbi:MAG: hypothetical protein LBH32_05490 [Dysgonamonadaceae bacterium]|nr:hypothetical protein [Dysgonamonadaceae bacterium]
MKEKKIFLKILLCLAMLTVAGNMRAQATFGSSTNPERGALIEIKQKESSPNPVNWKPDSLENATKGFIAPRVMLIAYDSLAPIYTNPTPVEKLKATGMVVYNVSSTTKGLPKGLAEWTGKEWASLVGNAPAKMIIDCNAVKVNGYYYKNKPLVPGVNTMSVPVQISKHGVYNIQAFVLRGNGPNEAAFSFSAKGEFFSASSATITLMGEGTPLEATSDIGTNNTIRLIVNGEEYQCQSGALPTVYVEKYEPKYTFDCSNVTVIGIPKKNRPINPLVPAEDLKIKVRIYCSGQGGSYSITTATINGIYFSATGQLTHGFQDIELQGYGTPLKSGKYPYLITGNSTIATATCTATVNVPYQELHVLIYSNQGDIWDLSRQDAAIPMMLRNPAIFDLGQDPNAKFHVDKINRLGKVKGDINKYNELSMSVLRKFSAIIISFEAIPNEQAIDSLIKYVKTEDGTLLYTTDEAWWARNRMAYLINKLSGFTWCTVNDAGTNKNMPIEPSSNYTNYPFVSGNLAVNGQYEDLTGKYLGRDANGNFFFANPPSDWIIIAGTRAKAKLIMHKKYRVFLSGDGGIFSGGYNYPAADGRAARVDANGNPIPAYITDKIVAGTPTEVHNAHFLANMLIWAFEASSDK